MMSRYHAPTASLTPTDGLSGETSVEEHFFPGLSLAARVALSQVSRRRQYAAGSTVQREGESSDRLIVLLRGQAKMCRMTAAGKNLIVSLLTAGDLFGIASAIGGEVCSHSVVAQSDLDVMILSRDAIFGLLARQPSLVREILPRLTGHVKECRNCLVEVSCSKVESRLAQLFCDLVERHGEANGTSIKVPISLSRQELADLAGTSIETAIRVMTDWGRRGLVETDRRQFVVHDLESLEDLALD